MVMPEMVWPSPSNVPPKASALEEPMGVHSPVRAMSEVSLRYY